MAENTFQVSSKLNDGRIFVIGGQTYDDFKKNLESSLGIIPAEEVLSTMAASIGGEGLASVPSVPQGVVAAPASPASGSAPTSRVCQHGTMTKRNGAGPKGPWKAFMCPSPKGTPDQCEPIWVRRNDAEWATF